jgi:CheY-like chemotaxis protein
MTVLLIDDDPHILCFLRRLITRSAPDQTVLTAESGLQGVQLALAQSVQLRLIVVDARLPGLDGQLVAAFLRYACPTVPMVALSGDTRTQATFAALGCVAGLTKGGPTATVAQVLHDAMQTPVAPPTITPLHQAMIEQVTQMLRQSATDRVLVERQALQRIAASLDSLARRAREPNRDLTRALKELERVM